MMPEPMTQAASNKAPSASARSLRFISRDFVGGVRPPYFPQALLQLDPVQGLDGQAAENLDAALEFVKRLAEGEPLLVSDPATAAGSSTPQCAVIGCPGQIGHISPAALSQTVNTKSSFGAPGCANSFQLFERMPSVGNFMWRSSSSAIGWTCPFGELPALKPTNFPRPQ